MRAISLFEFEVSLFYKLFQDLADGQPPKGARRNARLFAAIKLIEHLEHEIKQQQNLTGELSLKVLATNDDYCRIFDEVIRPAGGWPRIRQLPKASEFDGDVGARRAEAKAVAKMIDFSYRFANLKNDRKYKGRGGVSTARFVVRTASSYDSRLSPSTMKTRWRYYGSASVFIYLLDNSAYPFRPPRVATKSFATQLLQQAQNEQGLHQFFCAYQYITNFLSASSYNLAKLSLDLRSDLPPIPTTPFSADIETAIEASSHGDLD